MLHSWLRSLLLTPTLLLVLPAHATQRLTTAQLQEDLRVLTETISQGHPDPGHSVAPAALERALAVLRRELRGAISPDQAWLRLATLNPLLADGHFFVGIDNWRDKARTHLEQGGFFPYEVDVNADTGALVVAAELGGGPTSLRGARITRINGVDSARIVRRLLALTHGDSPAFRARLLAQRWFFFYWKAYGAPARFELSIERHGRRTVPAGRQLPTLLADEDSFNRTYRFELLPDGVAVLTLGSFAWPDPERYFAFTEEAFKQIREVGSRTLIIDVRNNGGGDDGLWINGVLRYIADQPYRWGSNYRKRVVEAYRNDNETTGEIVTGTIERWIEPELDHPLHFNGQVHVLVGPATYSSAVLFTNTVQDFGFGTVAGSGGSVRSRQSGGVQQTKLPNSGLVVYWPRFVLDRPAGAGGDQGSGWLEPDLPIPDVPLDPRAAIDAIVAATAARNGLQDTGRQAPQICGLAVGSSLAARFSLDALP